MNPNWTAEQQRLYSVYEQAISDLVDFSAPKPPAMGNKGTEQLVDMGGRFNELRKSTEKIEKLMKGIIDSRMEGKTELRGECYIMTKSLDNRYALNQGKAKDLLAAKGVSEDQYMDSSQVEKKTFRRI